MLEGVRSHFASWIFQPSFDYTSTTFSSPIWQIHSPDTEMKYFDALLHTSLQVFNEAANTLVRYDESLLFISKLPYERARAQVAEGRPGWRKQACKRLINQELREFDRLTDLRLRLLGVVRTVTATCEKERVSVEEYKGLARSASKSLRSTLNA